MIASFNEALTEGKLPAEAAVELRTRIAELEEDIRFMKIQSVIQDRPLRLVGQKKNFIREALFRAYGGVPAGYQQDPVRGGGTPAVSR